MQEVVTVNLAFTSNWLGKKHENFKPTVERNKQNPTSFPERRETLGTRFGDEQQLQYCNTISRKKVTRLKKREENGSFISKEKFILGCLRSR